VKITCWSVIGFSACPQPSCRGGGDISAASRYTFGNDSIPNSRLRFEDIFLAFISKSEGYSNPHIYMEVGSTVSACVVLERIGDGLFLRAVIIQQGEQSEALAGD
jgi:hypothetical protein